MTQGLGGSKSNQNANVMALIKEFQAEYGTYGGENPGLQTLITYKVLKNMAGGTTAATNATTGGVASTVTIRGSTGQTILTDESGRIVVANVANLLGRMPNLVDGKIPVGVTFPTNQVVTVSNQLSGFATEATLGNLLRRLPEPIEGKLPVSLTFPTVQRVVVDNLSADAASEETLKSLLDRTPKLNEAGLTPVVATIPNNVNVTVSNQVSDIAKESTLTSILSRLPELESGKLPVSMQAQANITGFSTEETLQSLLNKTPGLVDGRLPVSVTFPDLQQVRVSNPVTDGAKEATVSSILAKMPTLASGKVPVVLDFPSLTIANQITGYGTEATVANILAKLPTLTTSGKTPIDLDISALGKDATLSAILAKLPTLASGKTPVVLDFPSNQTVTVSNPSDMSALGKDSTLTAILNKLPALTQTNKTPVDVVFPTTQRVIVDNPTSPTDVSLLGREVTLNAILAKLPSLTQSSKIPVDVDLSTLGKDATLASILAKLPTLVNGKSPVAVDFPTNQTVTVSNPSAPTDVSLLGKDTTLNSILGRLPALVSGKTPVVVDFPSNQTVTVSNPSDTSLLGREITLNAILARLPVDLSRAIAQGFRTEFTTASPLATAIAATPLTDNPLWVVSRSKRIEGLDSFSHTFLGRRPNTFAASGFTDIAEFDLQTVGSNLRSPTLAGTQTLEIVSSSANDSANGTGIRTVEVMYLDENFTLRTTTVSLNGLVAVAIQLNGVAIKPTCLLEVQAIAYGSLQGAAGTITVRIPSGGLLSSPQSVDQITQGDTVSLSARCCIPDGYVGYLTEVSGCAITANHEFRLVATMAQSDKRLLDGVFNSVDLFSLNAGTIPLVRSLPYIELPSRCRVRLISRASATNTSASGGFTIVFVKKPL